MATADRTAANDAKYQALKEACDTFLESVKKELTFVEYPKWEDGVIYRDAEHEAEVKGERVPPPTPAPEAEARPAEHRKR